ncbi:M48 family metalloprotease [Tatumella saanichensis]|uniref:beta-barrel assembly-enhancing protease n=1 Tax=Tatumella saanichensis TaxID=480813 RepID=UPI0004A49259|nr:M48 family metallopeptidase [Tatumella saanichensis]
MTLTVKQFVAALLVASTCSLSVAPAFADVTDTLPDIGTTAGATLSVNEELQMGDFYVRELRASAPLINDPILDQYINTLGQRLVSHAWSVKTPFHFYLIQNDELNAFAFFGGNVVLHSALFRYTDNESELASVMAHEISHVTQRHLARAMEEQKRNAPLTWVGALGSILLAMANPQAGMAALTGTLAGSQQGVISFTRQNEQEADRIGIQVLQRAGFDPEAMPDFMQKLADMSRYDSKPPEMLLTHPLPDSRLADARNRANQMPRTVVHSSQDFYFAKVRILGMYGTTQSPANGMLDDVLEQYAKGNVRQQLAARYGKAVQFLEAKKFSNARAIIQPLLAQQPNNPWFLDIMTDIDIGLKQPQAAVRMLNAVGAATSKSPVLLLNLANASLQAGDNAATRTLLNRYTWDYPDDPNGWDLLAQADAALGLNDEVLFAQAQGLALDGKLSQAIRALSSASAQVPFGSLKQARYDARIDQLRQLQQRFRQYQKG